MTRCKISDWCCIYHACMSDDCQRQFVLEHSDFGQGNCKGLTDIQILERSYARYKDKNGRKAKNLKLRIEAFKAIEKITKELIL